MNFMPRRAETRFEFAAWKEELLVLNPWARGLDIAEADKKFVAEREKAVVELLGLGKIGWNDWAERMLAVKTQLLQSAPHHVTAPESNEMRYWCALARVRVAANANNQRAAFGGFVFPDAAQFDGVTFSSVAQFDDAIFRGEALFNRASFPDGARFGGATFHREAEV